MSEIKAAALAQDPSLRSRFLSSDILYSFLRSPLAIVSAVLFAAFALAAIFAPWIAPQNPFDLRQVDLFDSLLPPAWDAAGDPRYWLGTDDQGRDIFSTILYGARISLGVGLLSVAFAAVLGIAVGLVSGFVGGALDATLMRIADIQLSFPAILIALLVEGVMRAMLPAGSHGQLAVPVLVLAIALSFWVQYARTVRSSVMIERTKEYVQAAQVIGLPSSVILFRHILPNVMGPVLVIATIQLALAIITEATLSYLGSGVPATTPSLGTLIRIGSDYLFSGEWWIVIFPGLALVILVLAVNLLGDWLRDALNPKLR